MTSTRKNDFFIFSFYPDVLYSLYESEKYLRGIVIDGATIKIKLITTTALIMRRTPPHYGII